MLNFIILLIYLKIIDCFTKIVYLGLSISMFPSEEIKKIVLVMRK